MGIVTDYGHEDKVEYYQNHKNAEKDFYNRVRLGIQDENLPDEDNLDGGRPWKIRKESSGNKELSAVIHYWYSYFTDCGTEHDIGKYEIFMQKVALN